MQPLSTSLTTPGTAASCGVKGSIPGLLGTWRLQPGTWKKRPSSGPPPTARKAHDAATVAAVGAEIQGLPISRSEAL